MNVTKTDKAWLRDEFRKVWHLATDMIDYCTEKTSAFMVFPDATVVTFDKPHLKKDFCFGYGIQCQTEWDEAQIMADIAATSEEYFINRNMDDTDAARWMKYIEDDLFPFEPWLDTRRYDTQDDDCHLGAIRWEHWHHRDRCERNGWRKLTDDEVRDLYLLLYDEQMKFLKRLRTYLKRYGTSKLRTWTYWADE